MSLQSHESHKAPTKLVLGALSVSLAAAAVQSIPSPARASSAYTMLCQGFSDCSAKGYDDSGYGEPAHYDTMYWNMYSGSNCVNYVAYRMVEAGLSTKRPAQLKPGKGNAEYWGGSFGSLTDSTPAVGAIAWWKGGAPGAGSMGHVAYVEKIISPTDILISESNWGSPFDWRELRGPGGDWPSGFIHLHDQAVANTVAPAFTGTPQVGATLKVSAGKWTPKATASFQWYADGDAIPGATKRTYTPAAADLAKTLTAKVTAVATNYSAGAVTVSTPGAVLPGVLRATASPSLSGTAQVGDTLTVTTGGFAQPDITQTVQWYADGVPIHGATGLTFTPTQDQFGKAIVAKIATTKAGYTTYVSATAPTVPIVEPKLTFEGQVTGPVAGPTYDQALTASAGTIGSTTPGMAPGSSTVLYQWLRDGQVIRGANSPTYTPGVDDVGHHLAVHLHVAATNYDWEAHTYRVPGIVRTVPTIKVRTTGLLNGARVRVHVTTPGVAPTGKATITIGGQSQVVTLANGIATLTLHGLVAGEDRKVTVTYADGSTVLPGTTTTTVTVLSQADVDRAHRRAERAQRKAEEAKKAKQLAAKKAKRKAHAKAPSSKPTSKPGTKPGTKPGSTVAAKKPGAKPGARRH